MADADYNLKLPRFWIGLSLLVWGVLTNQWILGFILAAVAEFGELTPIRWELTSEHFYRVADLTSVFFAVVAIYQFNEHSVYGIYRILALLPFCVFPLLVAERFSTAGSIPMSALFLSLRRRVRHGIENEQYVDLAFPFMVITVLSASANEMDARVYFASAFVLVLGALCAERSRRFGFLTWVFAVTAVMLMAFAIQAGIRATQRNLEDSFSYWVNQFAWFRTDPRREITSIGVIGRLKLSDRIRVRVTAPLSMPLPLALHEASYSTFRLGTWSTPSDLEFSAIDPLPQTTIWSFSAASKRATNRSASIVTDHTEDVGVAPLPYGVQQIHGREIIELQRNEFGTTLIEALPGQLEYNVDWSSDRAHQSSPTVEDLSIPENYLSVVDQIVSEIGLTSTDSAAAVSKVKMFFSDNFEYSLIQKGFYPGRTPLSHFLLYERKGHCEYFATATALLLRRVGIPTRYAVGYMVYEYSALENAFIARARHAHSWVEAYVNGAWITVDTTPGGWNALESAERSNWQTIQDVWSWIANGIARYQRGERRSIVDTLVWLLPPMILFLAWRLRSRARHIRAERPVENGIEAIRGADSELYEVCELLVRRGFALSPGDTLKTYLTRHAANGASSISVDALVRLHYRYRFHATALSERERETLRVDSKRLGLHLSQQVE